MMNNGGTMMSSTLDTTCSLSAPTALYSPVSPEDVPGNSLLPGTLYSTSPIPPSEGSPSNSILGLYRPMTPPDASPNSGLLGSSGLYSSSASMSDTKLNTVANNGLFSPNSPSEMNTNAMNNSSVFHSPHSSSESDSFHVPSPSQLSGYDSPENLMYSPQWGRETPKSEPLDQCDSGYSKPLPQMQQPFSEADIENQMANDPKLMEEMQSFLINHIQELEHFGKESPAPVSVAEMAPQTGADSFVDNLLVDFFSSCLLSSKNPRAWLEQDVSQWLLFIIQRFALNQDPSKLPPINGSTLLASDETHLASLLGPDLASSRQFLYQADSALDQMSIKKEEVEETWPQVLLPTTVEQNSGAPQLQQPPTQNQTSYSHLQTSPQPVNSFEPNALDYFLDNIALENNNNPCKRADPSFPPASSQALCPSTHLETFQTSPAHSTYSATAGSLSYSTTIPQPSYATSNSGASNSGRPSLVQDMVFNTNIGSSSNLGPGAEDPADSDSEDSPHSPPSGGRHHIQLYQFLKLMLNNHRRHGASIRWINREEGIFKIENSTEVARQWGIRKNRPKMNYDKMSRSIRQYYDKGVMKKTLRPQRLVYQFCAKYAQ